MEYQFDILHVTRRHLEKPPIQKVSADIAQEVIFGFSVESLCDFMYHMLGWSGSVNWSDSVNGQVR